MAQVCRRQDDFDVTQRRIDVLAGIASLVAVAPVGALRHLQDAIRSTELPASRLQ